MNLKTNKKRIFTTWNTRTMLEEKQVIGYQTPLLLKSDQPVKEIELSNKTRVGLIQSYDNETQRKAIKNLFNEEYPELDYLDLRGILTLRKDEIPDNLITTDREIEKIDNSTYRFKRIAIVETIKFDKVECKKNRSGFTYQSVKYANKGTTTKTRYGKHSETNTPKLEDIKATKDKPVYITLKCAICGYQKRVKVVNRKRKTPICYICKSQKLFTKKTPTYDFKTDRKFKANKLNQLRVTKTHRHRPFKQFEDLTVYEYDKVEYSKPYPESNQNYNAYLRRL